MNSNKLLTYEDPFNESLYSPVTGLVHRYPNRVLIKLTQKCASYCDFCTRKYLNHPSEKDLSSDNLEKISDYIKTKKEVNEVIFSGGDPLLAEIFPTSLSFFAKINQIKILRIHTKLPVSAPNLINTKIIRALNLIKQKPIYICVHFEHPKELTFETVVAINKLRSAGAILLSQSVFLKGVNDSYEVLAELFTRLSQIGVRPYYLFRCDLISGAEKFLVPFAKEIKIASKLRRNLSGISCPLYVIDTPRGNGKIPVPLDFWSFDKSEFTDFRGKRTKLKQVTS